jgi:hypothetical protein
MEFIDILNSGVFGHLVCYEISDGACTLYSLYYRITFLHVANSQRVCDIEYIYAGILTWT